MLVVFTSFLLFFALLLWYADKHNKGAYSDGVSNKNHIEGSDTIPGFEYFDPNCSQFPLNFPRTTPRSLRYSASKQAK